MQQNILVEAAEAGDTVVKSGFSGNINNDNNKEGEDMENLSRSITPAGMIDQVQNPFRDIDIIKVCKRNLFKFDLLPEFFSPYLALYPFITKKDEENYWVIGGYNRIKDIDNPDHQFKCFYGVLSDNSPFSIALEKFAITERSFGGESSYAEKVWQSNNMEIFIQNNPNLNIVSGRGGARKGKNYESKVSLTTVMASRLGKEPGVITNYFTHAKDVPPLGLEKMAEAKICKNEVESFTKKKNDLLKSLEGKTQHEKNTAVLNLIWELLAQHQANKEKKEKDKEENKAKAKAAKALKAKEKSKTKAASAIEKTDEAPPLESDDNGINLSSQPVDDLDNNLPVEIDDEEEIVDLLMREDSELNVTQPPSKSLSENVSPAGGNSLKVHEFFTNVPVISEKVFADIGELGENLKAISDKKPPFYELMTKLNNVLEAIHRISTDLKEAQDATNPIPYVYEKAE